MWKNNVEPDRPQMTIWRMRILCWMPKARSTHWEYAIITAFPLQQWLQEHASVLCYTYRAPLVHEPYILLWEIKINFTLERPWRPRQRVDYNYTLSLISALEGLQSALHPHTVRLLTEGDDTRGCGDTIGPPEDEQRAARNMLRSVV